MCLFFFFQAEDGIRDLTVTGVQTCALPISDRHPLPEIEVGHRLLGARHHRVLAGDRRELGHGRFEPLGVLGRVPHSDVEHDLQEPRDLVRVLEPELLRQLGPHPLLVMVEQSRARRGLGRRPFGLRHRLPPPSLRRLLSLLVLLFLLLLLLLFRRFRRPLRAGLHRRGGRRAGGLPLPSAGRPPRGSPVGLLEFVFFWFRHRYLTRGVGWPDLAAVPSPVPSLSSPPRTPVG